MVTLGVGKNALRSFKTRWDAAVEKLVALGGRKDSDDETLYIHFKKQFMKSEDLQDSVAKRAYSRISGCRKLPKRGLKQHA